MKTYIITHCDLHGYYHHFVIYAENIVDAIKEAGKKIVECLRITNIYCE